MLNRIACSTQQGRTRVNSTAHYRREPTCQGGLWKMSLGFRGTHQPLGLCRDEATKLQTAPQARLSHPPVATRCISTCSTSALRSGEASWGDSSSSRMNSSRTTPGGSGQAALLLPASRLAEVTAVLGLASASTEKTLQQQRNTSDAKQTQTVTGCTRFGVTSPAWSGCQAAWLGVQ